MTATMVSVTVELQVPIPNLCCCCPHPKCRDALGEPEQRLERGPGRTFGTGTPGPRETQQSPWPPRPLQAGLHGGGAMPCTPHALHPVTGSAWGFPLFFSLGMENQAHTVATTALTLRPPTATRGAAQARKQPWGPRVERRALAPIGRLYRRPRRQPGLDVPAGSTGALKN